MAIVFAWAKEGSAFNYDRTTTFTGRNGHFQGSYVPLVFATSWQRRTNLWRGMTSPAQGPKRRRSGIGQVRPLRGLVVFNHATEVTTRRNYQNEETRLHSIGIDAHRRGASKRELGPDTRRYYGQEPPRLRLVLGDLSRSSRGS